jgi:hypothetical protein
MGLVEKAGLIDGQHYKACVDEVQRVKKGKENIVSGTVSRLRLIKEASY